MSSAGDCLSGERLLDGLILGGIAGGPEVDEEDARALTDVEGGRVAAVAGDEESVAAFVASSIPYSGLWQTVTDDGKQIPGYCARVPFPSGAAGALAEEPTGSCVINVASGGRILKGRRRLKGAVLSLL